MKRNGFTLVELLVVISIIAILSVIGITIFSSAQKSARDSKRRADIDSIAKALEIHYGECASAVYCNLQNSDFNSGGIPSDPLDGQSKCASGNNDFCGYCFARPDIQPGADGWANHGCDGLQNIDEGQYWYNKAQVDSPGGAARYYTTWELCANLETSLNGKYYYCRSSQR